MPSWLKNLLVILGILFLVFFYAGFQSYATKSIFIISLYEVITTLIGEVWKLVSTPTVFVAGLLFIILWNYRTKIETIFPALRELSAGGVSAKFDFTDILPSLPNSRLEPHDIALQDSSENLVREQIISHLGKRTSNLMLRLNDQSLTVDEFIDKIQEAKLFSSHIEGYDPQQRRHFYYGVFNAIWIYIRPFLIDISFEQNYHVAQLKLKPGVKELVEARLESIEQKERKNSNL